MRLHIIRHADPNYELDTITPDGHKEAEALSIRLEVYGLDRIYVSPMGRALETMRYTKDRLKMEYNVEHWTKELWPELSLGEEAALGNIMAIDIPGELIRHDTKIHTHEDWHRFSSFEGNDFLEIYEKLRRDSDSFLARHGYVREGGRYRCTAPTEEKIAVFCHNGFGLTWLAHLLELPPTLVWSGFWLPPSSVTTILFDKRSDEWATPRCIGLGDVSHLYQAGLPVKPRGIIANFY